MNILRRIAIFPLALTATSFAEGEWNPDTQFPALNPADATKTIEAIAECPLVW